MLPSLRSRASAGVLFAMLLCQSSALRAPAVSMRIQTGPTIFRRNLRGGSSVALSPEQCKSKLLELGQGHLFEGLNDAQTDSLLAQASELNSQLPGGLESYVTSARKLLREAAEGLNPFEGFTPQVPHGEVLKAETPEFLEMESRGLEALGKTGFVLVAGGLGERLGYNGIKISLPLYEADRGACFMRLYAEHILALQDKTGASMLPLAIMTSDDTHGLTVQLLEDHNNFGLQPGQITIMKQNKVPALTDSSAKFATSSDGLIDTKPHGHGDVHTLMHMTGVAKAWREMGIDWVVFFQDTNGIIFRALPAVLGVSVTHAFDINSVCVPRTPGEAVGGICKLNHNDGRSYTVNVEYNQLDPLLRSTAEYACGDVAGPTGHSPFPGNINCLVFGMQQYTSTLEQTQGKVNEFVNPKYADESKTTFKKPTRLECMMQDFPLLLPPEAKVGFTQLDRWLCFSPVKNAIADAAAKAQANLPPECAGTAERDSLTVCTRMLKMAGVDIPEVGTSGTFAGVPLDLPPYTLLYPSFASSFTEVNARVGRSADVKISARSALVLKGDVNIEGHLYLDGALSISAVPGARVVVNKLEVANGGWEIVPTSPDEEENDEMLRMRGYRVDKKETREFVFDQPGEYVIEE